MKSYVVGFAFDWHNDSVVLVRKNRPLWQEGLFNGVGGKIEAGETPLQAMVREFREETSVETDRACWREVGHIFEDNVEVTIFGIVLSDNDFAHIRTNTDEEIVKWPTLVPLDPGNGGNCISNIPTLLNITSLVLFQNKKVSITLQYD